MRNNEYFRAVMLTLAMVALCVCNVHAQPIPFGQASPADGNGDWFPGSITAKNVPPQQTTSGPVPPKTVADKRVMKMIPPVQGGASQTVAGVPGYEWRHGCGPTAVGMVLGYYDGAGFPDLFPGDAGSQTEEVNQGMASQGSGVLGYGEQRHYEDYALPEGDLPDRSENYPVGCHTDDSIADFMQTSWSKVGNLYGWSWSNRIIPAFTSYVAMRNPDYVYSAAEYWMATGDLTWSILKGEIDHNRPMAFIVDTDSNGATDHFVTVVGYSDGPPRQYGCLDTWDPCDQIRWCNFTQMRRGIAWGVGGGYTFRLQYSLSLSLQADSGFVSASPSQAGYDPGDIVNVTATPPIGYRLLAWSGDVPAGHEQDNPLILVMDGNKQLTASFTLDQKQYTLTYTAGANGSIKGTSPQVVTEGADGAVVEAVPDPGYQFVRWSDDSTANPRTDLNVSDDVIVTAIFEYIPVNAPSNPGMLDAGANALTWTWRDNSDAETGFKVWVDPGNTPPTTLQTTTAAGVQAWRQEGLLPNAQYAFQVSAVISETEDSALTPLFTAWTLAAAPAAPVVGGAEANALNVSIGVGDGNPGGTVYAINCITAGRWVQAGGALGASPAWRTAAMWGTTTVSGLAKYTTYAFEAKARNGGGVETAAGPSGVGRTLDATPPTGSVIINAGDTFTTNSAVALTLAYDDGAGSGVSDMRFSNDGTTWSEWESVAPAKTWTLADGADGARTVYVQYRDGEGNSSAGDITDGITLDVTAPTADITLSASTPTQSNVLYYSVNFIEKVVPDFSAANVNISGALAGTKTVTGTGQNYSVTITLTSASPDGLTGIELTGLADLAGNPMLNAKSPEYDVVHWPGFAASLTGGKYYTGGDAMLDASLATGGLRTPVWQWRRNDALKGEQSGPATAQWVLALTPAMSGDYWCTVTYGGLHFETDKVEITVADNLLVTSDPASQTVPLGNNATFTVQTTGGYTPLHYQWKKDGEDVPVGPDAAQYVINQVKLAQAGDYTVEVSDSFTGHVVSNPARLTVQRGVPVTVPSVVGKLQADAAASVQAAGLLLGEVTQQYSSTVSTGRVISQNPAADTSVETGSSVALVVSKGLEPVEVPKVTNMMHEAATAAIIGAGLIEGAVTQQQSSYFKAGLIIGQNPAAGSHVSPGSAVALVVSLGSPGQNNEGEATPPTLEETRALLITNNAVIDSNSDGQITYEEAAAGGSGLTQSVFDSLDTDGNGAITMDELNGGGCQCQKALFTSGGLKQRLGDLFLLGMALTILLTFHRHRP